MALLTTAEGLGLEVFRRGKVRDTFDLGDGTLLMVASDRLSAFDVVLPTPIPDKGRLLTQMSRWWFARTTHIIENHLLPDDESTLPPSVAWDQWAERSMRVRRARRIDLECVVRGYLAGSGWAEYRDHGTLAGEPVAMGGARLRESSKLPTPMFTPAFKNDYGHDENISRLRAAELTNPLLAAQIEDVSKRLFTFASAHCAKHGIILCDTKFEFGMIDGRLVLIDEIFTPDSSRFWDAEQWHEGVTVPALDKQFVRDYLATLDWDRTAPGPELPGEVVRGTQERYREAAERICGISPGPDDRG